MKFEIGELCVYYIPNQIIMYVLYVQLVVTHVLCALPVVILVEHVCFYRSCIKDMHDSCCHAILRNIFLNVLFYEISCGTVLMREKT